MIYECNVTQISVEYFYLYLATKNIFGYLPSFLNILFACNFYDEGKAAKDVATALYTPRVLNGKQFYGYSV